MVFGFDQKNPATCSAGVQRDWLTFSDTREDETWDAVRESSARIDDPGVSGRNANTALPAPVCPD